MVWTMKKRKPRPSTPITIIITILALSASRESYLA